MDFRRPSLNICDVVIVGGGLSGLTTAYYLAEKDPNLNVVILEKSRKLGGLYSVTAMEDLGGKYFTKHHHDINDLTEKLDINFTRREIMYHWRNFPDWHGLKGSLAKFEVLRFVSEIDVECQGYNPKRWIKRWNETMEQYIVRKLFFLQSQDFIRFIIKIVFGVDPSLIQVDEFLSVCFTCLSFSKMIDSLLEAELIPEGGWSRVIDRLANDLPESYHIIRETCVIDINVQTVSRNSLVVETQHGEKFQGKIVVIACPWQSVKQIKFTPSLGSPIMNRVRHIDAYVTTFTLKYNIPAWKRIGHSGCIFDYKNNLHCSETEPCVLSGALYHNSISEISQYPIAVITQLLAKKFGADVLLPAESEAKVFEHQILIDFPITEENRGTIVWATTNNSTIFRGFINGAVHSGLKAAITTLKMLRPSTIESSDEGDTDAARHQMHGLVVRYLMGINIATSVRTVKIFTVASLGYFLFKRFLKDYANELVGNFLKGSN